MKNSSRPDKGLSLIASPSAYTVIDLETTGLSPDYDAILEFAAIKVKNNQICDTFSSLVNDQAYVDDFITDLTGITQDMIDSAPPILEIFPQFLDFVGDDIVIGHNVNFDINFLYDNSVRIFNRPFSNDFVDTMRLSRRLYPQHRHHRLSDVADYCNIQVNDLHRALADCQLAFGCYNALVSDIGHTYHTFDAFAHSVLVSSHGVRASDISSSVSDFDISHPFYQKTCVFTGKLEKMTRKEAMQIIADVGGINGDNVTQKTNYLILGNNDYCSTIKDGKSSKQKKAESLKLKGQDIEILPESVFYDIINDYSV